MIIVIAEYLASQREREREQKDPFSRGRTFEDDELPHTSCRVHVERRLHISIHPLILALTICIWKNIAAKSTSTELESGDTR